MGRTSRASFSQVSASAKTEFEKARKEIDRLSKDIVRLDRESAAAGKRGNTELAASFKAQADVQRGEMEKASQVAIAAQGRIASEAVKTGNVTKTALTSGVSGAGAAFAREGGAISRVMGDIGARATVAGRAIQAGLSSGAFESIGKKATLAGAGVLAGFAVAEKATIGFDKALSNVAAVGGKEATARMGELRQAALDAGAATSFTASDAVRAEAELAKAGIGVSSVLGGALLGSLNLAAAGQLDLAEAATIAATTMTQFSLSGKDVTHIADVLTAGANKSTASVQSLALGLSEAGGVAKVAHFSLEDTVATLALFDQNALKGAEGGTAFKTMLLKLIAPVPKARQEMEKLGISVYDSNKAVRPAAELMDQLRQKMGPLSEQTRNAALQTIFGTRAIRGAIIATEQGAAGWEKWRKAVDDSGAAQRAASTQMDNLSGDIERLKGSIEVGLIGSGSAATGVLRTMAAGATGAVNAFAGLPGPVQGAAGGFVALAGGALAVSGVVGVLAPRISALNTQLKNVQIGGFNASQGLGLLGKAAGGAVAIGFLAEGIFALAGAIDHLKEQTPHLNELQVALLNLGKGGKGFEEIEKNARHSQEAIGDYLDAFKDPGSFQEFRNAQRFLKVSIEDVDKALAAIVSGGAPKAAASALNEFLNSLHLTAEQRKILLPFFDDYNGAVKANAAQNKVGAEANRENAGAIAGAGTAAAGAGGGFDKATKKAEKASKALKELAKNFAESILKATDPGAALDKASEASKDAIQKAVDAAEKGQKVLVGKRLIDPSFFSPDIGPLAAKLQQAEDALKKLPEGAGEAAKAAAQANVDAAKAALEDLPNQAQASLAEFTRVLEEGLLNIGVWQGNLRKLAAGGHIALAEEFAKMGPTAAPLVAKAVTSSDAELDRLEGDFRTRAAQGTGAVAAELEQARTDWAAVTKLSGDVTVQSLAKALGVAPTDTEKITDRVKLILASLPPETQVKVQAIADTLDAEQKLKNLITLMDTAARSGLIPRRGTFEAAPRAKGGPVHRNTPYEVGEQGVEAFVPAIRKPVRQKSMVAKLAQTAEAQAREQLVTLGIAAPRQPPAERTVPLTQGRKGHKPRPSGGPGRPQADPKAQDPRKPGLREPSLNERRVGAIERVVNPMRVTGRNKVGPLVAGAVEDREKVEKRARGGVVRGKPRLGVAAMLLGQHGPQLFVPPTDGVVVKASDTRALLRAREPKQIEAILSRAGADRRTLAAVAPRTGPVGRGTPRRAGGGPVRRSQPYTVGERGPEAFVSTPIKREGGGLTIQVGDTKVNVSANTQAHVKGVSEADVNKIVARNQQRLVAELAQLVEKGQR